MNFHRYRIRKQRSLDGTVAGMESNRYHPGHWPISAPIDLPHTGPQDYLQFFPEWYDPDPGFDGFTESDYEIHEQIMAVKTGLPPIEPPAPLPDEPAVPDYDALPMNDDVFEEAMHNATAMPDETTVVPFDNPVMANELIRSDHPLTDSNQVMPDSVSEAQAIFDEQMAMFEQQEMPEPDPFEMQQQMYDSQMQQFMDPWMMPGMGPGM